MCFLLCYDYSVFQTKRSYKHMRFKAAKFLIGLSMSLSLAGCSLLPNFNSNKPQSSEEGEPLSFINDNSNPTSSPEGASSLIPTSAANNGVGDDVEGYQGNQSRTIETINNTPVSQDQPATMEKIRAFTAMVHGDGVGQDMVDAFAECMLAFNIGDELACEFCDFMLSSTTVGQDIINEDNYADLLADYYYNALKLLNSVDFGTAANFFTVLNRKYKEMCTKGDYYDVSNMTIIDYYNPSYGYDYLSYAEYMDLKSHLSDYDNADLTAIVSAYDSAYSSFKFTDSQIASFNEAMAERQEEADRMIVVPDYFISFLRNHAAQSKTMLMNKLKLVVDATTEFAPLVLDYTRRITGSSYYEHSDSIHVENPNGYGTSLYHYENDDDSSYTEFTIRDYAAKFLEKRQIVLGLAQSILTDEQFGDLIIDAASEVILPLLRDVFPENEHNNAIFTRLNTKINALSGKHIKALASFLLKVINEVYDDDIINLLVAYNDETPDDFDILIKLDGVGRKTANVFLSEYFDKDTLGVDTHIERVSKRLGIANKGDTVLLTEQKLKNFIQGYSSKKIHHMMIAFGRNKCSAKKPLCEKCKFKDCCNK